MAKVQMELNTAGVGQLLKSQEMQNMLRKQAATIASKSGGESEVYVAQTRAVAEVRVDNNSTNMDNNTLLKALR